MQLSLSIVLMSGSAAIDMQHSLIGKFLISGSTVQLPRLKVLFTGGKVVVLEVFGRNVGEIFDADAVHESVLLVLKACIMLLCSGEGGDVR